MTVYATRLQNSQDTITRMRMADALPLTPSGAGTLQARGGLRADGGGQVTVVEGTMDVQVTPFMAWVDGGASDAQGGYPFVSDATLTFTLSAGDAVNDRVDTVVGIVRDGAFDGSGATVAAVEVVEGIPGAGAPTLPDTCVPLRDITVPVGTSAGTGGLSSSNLGADRRSYTTALGGILPIASVTERDAMTAQPGWAIYRLDTGALELHDPTDGWVPYARDVVPYLHVWHPGLTRAPGGEYDVGGWNVAEAQWGASVSGADLTFGPAGLYAVELATDVEGASGGYVQAFLDRDDGSHAARGILARSSNTYETVHVSKTIRVQDGETFRVRLQASGSNNGTHNFTGGKDRFYLTAVRVGS